MYLRVQSWGPALLSPGSFFLHSFVNLNLFYDCFAATSDDTTLSLPLTCWKQPCSIYSFFDFVYCYYYSVYTALIGTSLSRYVAVLQHTNVWKDLDYAVKIAASSPLKVDFTWWYIIQSYFYRCKSVRAKCSLFQLSTFSFISSSEARLSILSLSCCFPTITRWGISSC